MMDYQENYEEEVVRNPDNIVIRVELSWGQQAYPDQASRVWCLHRWPGLRVGMTDADNGYLVVAASILMPGRKLSCYPMVWLHQQLSGVIVRPWKGWKAMHGIAYLLVHRFPHNPYPLVIAAQWLKPSWATRGDYISHPQTRFQELKPKSFVLVCGTRKQEI